MEKLFIIKKVFFVLLFISSTVYSQNLYIFETYGQPKIVVDKVKSYAKKGDEITKLSSVMLTEKDSIKLVNKLGEIFKIDVKGVYNYKEIKNVKPITNNTSFTKKYFAYVFKRLTNKQTKQNKAGVVYRADLSSLILNPNDSTKIYLPEIKFEWINRDNDLFFFLLKEENSEHITKIGTRANQLLLFVDNAILKRGKKYKWTITKRKFPDFEKLTFYNFELLNAKSYKALQEKIAKLTIGLQKLGFNNKEIKKMIQKEYYVGY